MGLDSGTTVAIVALVVSLVALLVASGQFLAQVFATADGKESESAVNIIGSLRRCQESVIGAWSKNTKLNWKWTEFRFETLFTTPEISLQKVKLKDLETSLGYTPFRFGNDRNEVENDTDSQVGTSGFGSKSVNASLSMRNIPIVISGSQPSKKNTFTPDSFRLQQTTSLASWISFLDSIHDHAEIYARPYSKRRFYPVLRKIQRSWDFMPPDVIRPLATTNVGDIALLARRMGMRWTVFKPDEASMRAEGGPHIISSVTVRSLGLVLEYKHRHIDDERMEFRESPLKDGRLQITTGARSGALEMGIWTEDADKLLFGILPENHALEIPRMNYGSVELLCQTLTILHGNDDRARRYISGLRPSGFTHGACDVLSMSCPMIREKWSPFNRLYVPGYWAGLTYFRVAYLVWWDRFTQEINEKELDSPQIRWLEESYLLLRENWPNHWDQSGADKPHEVPFEFLDKLHDLHGQTDVYFQDIADQTREQRISYMDLLSTHLIHAPMSLGDSQKNVREGKGREHHNTGDQNWRGEAMHCYFDYIPRHVEYLSTRGCKDTDLVFEVWCTMIFRGFLWQRSHDIASMQDAEPPMDSRYYRSKMPVYIG